MRIAYSILNAYLLILIMGCGATKVNLKHAYYLEPGDPEAAKVYFLRPGRDLLGLKIKKDLTIDLNDKHLLTLAKGEYTCVNLKPDSVIITANYHYDVTSGTHTFTHTISEKRSFNFLAGGTYFILLKQEQKNWLETARYVPLLITNRMAQELILTSHTFKDLKPVNLSTEQLSPLINPHNLDELNEPPIEVSLAELRSKGREVMSKERYSCIDTILAKIEVGQEIDADSLLQKLNHRCFALSLSPDLKYWDAVASLNINAKSIYSLMEFADGWLPFGPALLNEKSAMTFGYIDSNYVVIKRKIVVEEDMVIEHILYPDLPTDVLPVPSDTLFWYDWYSEMTDPKHKKEIWHPFRKSISSKDLYPYIEQRTDMIETGESVEKAYRHLLITYSHAEDGEILLIPVGLVPEYEPDTMDVVTQKFLPIGYYENGEPVCMRKIYFEDEKVSDIVDCTP